MDSLIDRRMLDSTICNGKPIIEGKRIAVQTILELLNSGDYKEDISNQYPSLKMEDINACMKFAAQ